MIFKSQLRRQAIVSFFLTSIPSIIIAGAVAKYFESGFIGFAFVLAGLFALGIVSTILHLIVRRIYFVLFGRRTVQKHIYDYLIINHYPAPKAYESSAEDYFISVMKNKEFDPELRIKAAMEVGTFAAYSGALDRHRLNQISVAAEDAINDYHVWIAGTRGTIDRACLQTPMLQP
jgi:hypothetical protein